MTLIRDFNKGIAAYGKAISFIGAHRLHAYFILPLVLNILLFAGGLSFIGHLTDLVRDLIFNTLDEWIGEWSWINYLKQAAYVLLWIVFKLIYLMLFAFFGGFIVLILMSPMLALLSEKTEQLLSGKQYPFSAVQFMKDIVRGTYIASRNLVIELLFTLLFFLLGFLPLINLLAPIGLFLIAAYFYGFSFMDYTNERKKRSVKEGVYFIRRYKGTAVANGMVFSFFLMIPYAGVFLASFTSVVSVVAATISSLEAEQELNR